MVKQYPDKVTLTTPADSTQDAQGDWIPGTGSTVAEFDCRYEPNTGNRIIVGEDGNRIDFSGTLYLQTKNEIAVGTALEVVKHNGSTVKGTVKGFHAGQMNARIWM